MKRLFILISFIFLVTVSSVSYDGNLLNQDCRYLISGHPTRNTEVDYYCNLRTLKQYNNGYIRLWVCSYLKPCDVTDWREAYFFYDTEIDGFHRMYRLHAITDSIDGKTINSVSPMLTSWTPYTSSSIWELIFHSCYRR